MKYYLPFIPHADVNYFYLFGLIDIASYTPSTHSYDTVQYRSVRNLAEKLNISQSTVNRMLSDQDYKEFFTVDKNNKIITLKNSFFNQKKQENTPIEKDNNKLFISLSENEVAFLRQYNDNLLCKYYIYTKFYCVYAAYKKQTQDFTAD